MSSDRDKYEHVPAEMRELRQWVIWGVNEQRPKIPYNPHSPTVEAKANDSSTWTGFDAAVRSASRLGRCGIGFEFGEPGGIAGVDLDHVINEGGGLSEWAAEVVRMLDSYTELSVSGRGLHILFKITEPLSSFCAAHKKQITGGGVLEVYDTGRYFTVTGRVYGDVKGLNERTDALKKVCDMYLAKPPVKDSKEVVPDFSREHDMQEMSDAELWERMMSASNGENIRALYEGHTGAYGDDDSAADLALCNHLAYWTGNDSERIDRMFRQSGLMREKWERVDYRDMTIAEAIRKTAAYTPPARAQSNYPTERKQTERQAPLTVEDEEKNVMQARRPVSDYLPEFLKEVLKSREGKPISTGFQALDKLLGDGLYPGLYFVGAISALGKTTFALQIADNIAKGGNGVLIFSLEMSRNELMAKTLSRLSLMQTVRETFSTSLALTTRSVLRASFSGKPEQEILIRQAVDEYSEWAENITIIEGIGDIGASTVRKCVEVYMEEHGGQVPVVVIDYLQIMAPVDMRASDKQNVDKNVLELKRLSREYQIPVIGISSFNRENYKEAVSMASFKESGAIEYGSDVLIGLQVDGIDREDGEKDSDYRARVSELLGTINANKERFLPVPIEAKILKHRNGVPGSVRFEFHSRFNYFKESELQ